MNGKLLKPGEEGEIDLGNHSILVLKLVTKVATEGSAARMVSNLVMAYLSNHVVVEVG